MPSTEPWIAVRAVAGAWFGFCCRWSAVWLIVLCACEAVAQGPPGAPPSQPVVAAEIVQRSLAIDQTFVGTVVAKRTSQVGSPVEGRVIDLLVEEGEPVQQGDKLAQLRTESLEIELAAAQAELGLLKQELERFEVAGPKEIAQAKARMLAAEALKGLTKARVDRSEPLLASRAISKDDLEEMVSAATGALQVHEERTVGWELAVATLPMDIAQAQSKIQVQEETIRLLEDDIAEHTILAPFDGYVSQEHTEVGQWIAKGGLVVEVVELGEVDVQLPVLETYVSQLRVRAKDRPGTTTRRVEIGALPGVEFQGEVVAIVPKADLNARTFPVNVRVTNRMGPNGVLLKPGMFARVTLPVLEIPDAVLVPKDALVLGEGSKIVWAVLPEADFKRSGQGRAVPIPVTTGESDKGWIQVGPLGQDGQNLLRPGGLVVVEGNER
ncbi:MAG: hypothetical protein A2V98_04350, partial [Planctomycetes bacterium RBG_16_64_12]